MKTNDGRLYVISGASRSGKTALCTRLLKSERRAVAWDPEDQWASLPGWRKVTNRRELFEAMRTPGYMRLAYVCGGDLKAEFDFLCACVLHAGRFVAPLVFVAEELADVTTPAKAPNNWGILVRRGLKRGISIYAISQRWAEADKTAFGNASEYIVFPSRADDIGYIARKTGLPEIEVAALVPLEYIRFDPVTKVKSKKKLRF
jgi:hypothetical protein